MNDPSMDRAKFQVGARAMRGAPMGKSVFRLLRAAHPDISSMIHQPPLKNYGHEPLPFKATPPIGGFSQ